MPPNPEAAGIPRRRGIGRAAGLLLVLLVPVFAPILLLTAMVGVGVCAEPLDATTVREQVERRLGRLRSEPAKPRYAEASLLGISLPHGQTLEEFVDDVLRSDVAKYWFHTVLGRSLEVAYCSPSASGLQWIKAAAHARTPRQIERSANGIRRDLGRSGNPAETEGVLCAWMRAAASPPQTAAMASAGAQCSG